MEAVFNSTAALRVKLGIWSFIDSLATHDLRQNYTDKNICSLAHIHVHRHIHTFTL